MLQQIQQGIQRTDACIDEEYEMNLQVDSTLVFPKEGKGCPTVNRLYLHCH